MFSPALRTVSGQLSLCSLGDLALHAIVVLFRSGSAHVTTRAKEPMNSTDISCILNFKKLFSLKLLLEPNTAPCAMQVE